MPTWTFEARDANGQLVRGEREAPDRQSALDTLRAQGLFLTRLEAVVAKTRAAQNQNAPMRPRPPIGSATPAVASAPASATSPVRPIALPQVPVENRLQPRPAHTIPTPHGATPSNSAVATANAAMPPNAAPRGSGVYVGKTAAPDTGSRVRAVPPLGQSAADFIPPQPLLQASSKDLSIFFGQVAALLHAGATIGVGLNTMSNGPVHPSLRKASQQLGQSLMNGGSISKGMEAFPGLFSPLVVGITRAGELGGFLEASFIRLSKYAERDYELETSVKRETWYPKLLVVCAIFIPAVVPLVLQGFKAFVAQVLPPMLVIGAILIVRFILKRTAPLWANSDRFARPLDEIKMVFPVLAKITRGLASAKFCRALGALYSAGVGPGESVRLSARACGNKAFEARALRMIPRLEYGETFTACMSEVGQFNPLALQMMRIGEESGSLDEQLDKAADFLEVDAETAIKQAVPVMGILVFLCIAGYIGLTVAKFYMGYANDLNGMIDQGS